MAGVGYETTADEVEANACHLHGAFELVHQAHACICDLRERHRRREDQPMIREELAAVIRLCRAAAVQLEFLQ